MIPYAIMLVARFSSVLHLRRLSATDSKQVTVLATMLNEGFVV